MSTKCFKIFLKSVYKIGMNYFGNAISQLFDTVSVQLVSTQDVLGEKLLNASDNSYFLYQKTEEKLGYGHTPYL